MMGFLVDNVVYYIQDNILPKFSTILASLWGWFSVLF